MKKIKIVHIAEAAGGVDSFLKMLLKYTDHDRFYIILVCSQNYDIESYKGLADLIIQIDMAHELSFKEDLHAIKEIREILKKNKPDIVYAHSSKAGALVRTANVGIDNICIYNPHGWAFNMKISKAKRHLYRVAEKIGARHCDKIICISDAEKQSAILNKICKPNQINVIYNGIDIDHTVPSDDQCNIVIPQGAVVIGMVGRISKQKAPDVFVEAASLIKKEIDNAFFIIVGDGDDRQKIQSEIHSLGLEKSVSITGWVNNPGAYMKLFDVGLLLSRWEGFGLVLPELMNSGVPIVATNVDAIPNIIENGYNGTLVSVDSPSETKNAVIQLLTNKDLYNSYVENGHKTVVERFDVRRNVKEHEILWTELYDERRANGK